MNTLYMHMLRAINHTSSRNHTIIIIICTVVYNFIRTILLVVCMASVGYKSVVHLYSDMHSTSLALSSIDY